MGSRHTHHHGFVCACEEETVGAPPEFVGEVVLPLQEFLIFQDTVSVVGKREGAFFPERKFSSAVFVGFF